MASFLDDGVGNVTAALAAAGMWGPGSNTLLVATSDNGGPEHGNEGTESNNYPLRGGKNTIAEGGTRVVGLVAGAGIAQPPGSVCAAYLHATDWLPSLVTAAARASGSGADWTSFAPPGEPPYLPGDGLDAWATLANCSAVRDWLLLETHPPGAPDRVHGDGVIVGGMKLVRFGPTMPADENGWFPPPGQDPHTTHYTLACPGVVPGPAPHPKACFDAACLFNLTADPCETTDVSAAHPDVVAALQARLDAFAATAVPPVGPSGCDPVKVLLPDGTLAWRPCDGA